MVKSSKQSSNKVIQTIKKIHGHALLDKCCEHGVEIKIRKDSCTAIFKGEKLVSDATLKMCDCIIFYNNCIFLIELKSAHLNYNSIVTKFQNSYKKSTRMLKSVCQRPFTVFFIVVAKKYGNHYTTQELKSGFKIDNKRCRIILAKSQKSLDTIIIKSHLDGSFCGNNNNKIS